MTLTLILTGVFSGVIGGVGLGFLIFAFKKKSQIKNSIKRIRNQKMKYMEHSPQGNKSIDFVGKIDKELKKKSDGPKLAPGDRKPKNLIARIKSMRKPKEVGVRIFTTKKKKKIAFVGKSPGKRKKVKKKEKGGKKQWKKKN